MMITVPKLVLIIVVIVAVWYAMRVLNRSQSAIARRRQQRRPQQRPGRQSAIEDLVVCRICGAYVDTHAAACGKPGCPQPR